MPHYRVRYSMGGNSRSCHLLASYTSKTVRTLLFLCIVPYSLSMLAIVASYFVPIETEYPVLDPNVYVPLVMLVIVFSYVLLLYRIFPSVRKAVR